MEIQGFENACTDLPKATGQTLLKFVTFVSPLISVDVHKYAFTAIILPYLSAASCPVFRANLQPERESDVDAPMDWLPAAIQLSRVYPYVIHMRKYHRLLTSFSRWSGVESLGTCRM